MKFAGGQTLASIGRLGMGLSLLLVLAVACSRAEKIPRVLMLNRGLSGEPASLDPSASIDNFSTQVVTDLYEGLTNESPTGEVLPGVASSWKIDSTGTEYTFILRKDARWSNGQSVKAQQFVDAWRRVLDPKTGSSLASDLSLIAGASSIIAGNVPSSNLKAVALSDELLVVKIERPASFFPQLLAHPAAFPIFSDISAKSHKKDEVISNGPYALEAWHAGNAFELKKNVTYWNAANVHIDKIKYLINADANAQLSAYRAGQIDVTDTIPSTALPDLRREHGAEIVIAPYLATAFYALNTVNLPLSGSKKIRKALAMSIDRATLVKFLGLGQIAAFGLIPPGTLNYEQQSFDWKSLTEMERLDEARKLYAEAGYSPHHPLHLRLLLNSSPSIKQTALLIAAMWKEQLGVETEMIDEEFRVFLQSRQDRARWEVARLAWNADYNDASSFLDVFRSGSSANDSGFKSVDFDDLLKRASATQDDSLRKQLLEKAERTLIENYPIIPLYFFVSKRLVKTYVHGVHPNLFDRVESKMLSMDDR